MCQNSCPFDERKGLAEAPSAETQQSRTRVAAAHALFGAADAGGYAVEARKHRCPVRYRIPNIPNWADGRG